MASADLKKHMSKTACCGISRHNYRDGRNHSNSDIDPERSHLNRHYGPQTSEEFRAKYHEMVREFDRRIPPKRKKQDRKTSLGIVIPSPREGMTPAQEAAWSAAAYRAVERLFPGQVVGGTYHADEAHKYIDNGVEHISRGHTHIEVIPWHPEKGLNMDAFYKRSLPNKINAALDEVCQEMFGFSYRDGSQAKSRGNVERLKAESAKAEREAEEQNVERLQNAALDLQGDIIDKQEILRELESAKSRFKAGLDAWTDAHHGLARVLRGAWRLDDDNRGRIGSRMEQAVKRGEAAIAGADDVDSLLAAVEELERGRRIFDAGKKAAKENLDVDELIADDDFGLG